MKCLEISMTVNYDPARIDPLFVALYRSFTLLRRVLLEGEDRYHMFCRNILRASVQANEITGPLHGFLNACNKLDIKISRHGEDIYITSPHGTGTKLNSLDRTVYNSIIRGNINYTIPDQLRQRVVKEENANYRKDMPGVDPYIDIRASRVNIASPLAANGTDLPNYTGDKLTAHTRNAIFAGSVRAPDLLKAAKLMASDICEHPDCKGARCTTEHLFRDCAAHSGTRSVFKDRIAKQMGAAKTPNT